MRIKIYFSQIVIISLSILLSGCGALFGDAKYEVTCRPGGFNVTYDKGGNTEQRDVSSGSWSKNIPASSGDFVYVSAQAENENATVTAKIYYNGKVIEKATSSGDYVIATASGSVP